MDKLLHFDLGERALIIAILEQSPKLYLLSYFSFDSLVIIGCSILIVASYSFSIDADSSFSSC